MAHDFSLSIFCKAYHQAASWGATCRKGQAGTIFDARQLPGPEQDLVAEGLQHGVMRVLSMSSAILINLSGISKHMSFVPKTNRIDKRFSLLPIATNYSWHPSSAAGIA